MTREDIRIECLRLALEAGQGPAEMVAIAAAREDYVSGKPEVQKSKPARVR
jgi:hypothetical protein